MRGVWAVLGVGLLGLATSCAFLLDFDELQSTGDAGSSSPGGSGGSGGNSGSGNGGTGGGIPDELPLPALGQAVVTASCQLFSTCYGPVVEVVSQGLPCEAYFLPFIQDQFVAPIVESVQDGTITYSPKGGADCVKAIAAANAANPPDCKSFEELIENCKSAFGNLKNDTEACKHRFECTTGTYCDLSGCPAATCKPLGGVGTPCLGDSTCNSLQNLYCRKPSGDDAGASGTCQAYVATNATCNVATQTCETGSLCIESKCKRIANLFTLAETDKCYTSGFLCNPGLACEFAGIPFLSDGACIPPKQAGAPCRLSVPEACPAGSYCTANVIFQQGTCQLLPTEGQPCAKETVQSIGLRSACAPGLACVADECLKYAHLGEACTDHAQCYSGICAGIPSGQCIPPACQ